MPNRAELASWPPPGPNRSHARPARRAEDAVVPNGRLLAAHAVLWTGLLLVLLAQEPISTGLREVFPLVGTSGFVGFAAANWVVLTLPLVAAVLVLGEGPERTVFALAAVFAVVMLRGAQAALPAGQIADVIVGAAVGGLLTVAWIVVRGRPVRALAWAPVAILVVAAAVAFVPPLWEVIDDAVLVTLLGAALFLVGPAVAAWLAALTARSGMRR